MKNMKKFSAIVLAIVMVLMYAVPMSVFAVDGESTVKIEITRDTSYDGTGDGNTYTWYRVFTASYDTNTSTGGGSTNGLPGDVSASAEHAAYTATSAVAAKLGTWDAENKTWTKATGNSWFKLTPIAGTEKYSVVWDNSSVDSATAQAAAKWLYDNQVYEASGNLSYADGKFSADGLDKGYYLINGVTGKNLVAATTDITINEKNVYPSDDKKQADEDHTTMSDDSRDVAVGDVLNYEVTVHIPATAKVGDLILVWDKASTGLTYNNDVKVKSGSNTGNATVGDVDSADQVAGATWQKLITVTANSQDTDVVFEFTMTVNSNALTDTDKKNESGLKYGNTDGSGNKTFPYESTPDKVEYKTYFAGIHKIDGDTSKNLEGVKFELKEAGVAFNVTKGADGVYTPGGSSNEVVTDKDGLIKIRGLDKDKAYTLTETETLDGYNMLDSDVKLTLHEDTVTTLEYTPATEYVAGTTYYVKAGTEYTEATGVTADNFAEGTYYTKTTSTSSSFTNATDDSWGEVQNKQGSVLPSTGGIGTTIFYILGTILVLGAGVLLVTRRRMRSSEE